jgi:hypothetical protein
LKGRHLRHAKEDHGGAMRAFEEAVRLDPGHAPSWTGLAESTLIASFSELSGRDACARARKALATAVALEGESADSLDGETARDAIDLDPLEVLEASGVTSELYQSIATSEPSRGLNKDHSKSPSSEHSKDQGSQNTNSRRQK